MEVCGHQLAEDIIQEGRAPAQPHGKLLPFGFDADWYFGINCSFRDLRGKAQLPFGFDVDWYRERFDIRSF